MKITIKPTFTKLPSGQWRAWNRRHGINTRGATKAEALTQFEQRCAGKHLTEESTLAEFERATDICARNPMS